MISLVMERGRVHLNNMKQFINNNWPKFKKVYSYLLYTTRASLLLYVAWFAFQNAFYAWAIAFVYFAFIDYYQKFQLA